MVDVFYSKGFDAFCIDKLKNEFENTFFGCKKIAIKMHFGEPGNETALKPSDILPVIRILEKLSIDYFLFDSSVMYGGVRGNPKTHKEYAIKKGFRNVETDDSEFIFVKKEILNYEVCKKLVDADAVLILSHFKGHPCSGFGGAIKNLGMGALTKNSKSKIHDGGKPKYVGGCISCGECEISCPINGIKVTDHPEFIECWGCSKCFFVCQKNCIKLNVDSFDKLLAEGASAAYENFKKSYCVNIVKNITKQCDCMSNSENIISKDVGILFSKDVVAIDNASRDLVLEIMDDDVFLKYNKKTGLEHLSEAKNLNMGSLKYELIRIS